MIYRRFGRTGLERPVLTCGGMRFQQSWQDLEPAAITAESQDNLAACVRKALQHGINHFETARGYGASERQLGRILPDLPRDEIIVQTKGGPQDSAAEFLKAFETSMARLRLDYLDLFAFHGVNNEEEMDKVLERGNLEAARKLQQQGRIRFIGFSSHGRPTPILRGIQTDAFDYVNLHWFYVDQINAPVIEAAAKHDMGVLIISPNDKGGKLYDPSAKLVELCKPLTPIGVNGLFCLRNPHVHTLSIGAARPSDYDELLDVVHLVPKAEAVLEPILARLEAERERVLGRDWLDNWQVNLPTWDQVPGGVNIYHILRLYNHYQAFDMLEYGKMRYNLLGSGGHWFPGYKVDKMDWDKLPEVLKDSPVAELIPGKLKAAHQAFNAEDKKRLSQSAD